MQEPSAPEVSGSAMEQAIAGAQHDLFRRELISKDLQMVVEGSDEGVLVGLHVNLEFETGVAEIVGYGKTPAEALKGFQEALDVATTP